ncbi:hypothetical protein D3C85_1614700 [compost metagenome]
MRRMLDQALGFQPLERLAYWQTADPETLGQCLLLELYANAQLTIQDHLFDGTGHRVRGQHSFTSFNGNAHLQASSSGEIMMLR